MTAQLKDSLAASLKTAASQAGLSVLSVTSGSDFNGHPTTIFHLGLSGAGNRTLQLELSEASAIYGIIGLMLGSLIAQSVLALLRAPWRHRAVA